MKYLAILLTLLGCIACSPTAPTKTCLDPRKVAPGAHPGVVGVVTPQNEIIWVKTDLPFCPPERLQ